MVYYIRVHQIFAKKETIIKLRIIQQTNVSFVIFR